MRSVIALLAICFIMVHCNDEFVDICHTCNSSEIDSYIDKFDIDINSTNWQNYTCLDAVIHCHRADLVIHILNKNITTHGAIHKMLSRPYQVPYIYEIMNILIDTGYDVDEYYNSFTSLNLACELGDHYIVEFLLEKGANIYNYGHEERYTSAFMSCNSGNPKLIELLNRQGIYSAFTEYVDSEGNSCLMRTINDHVHYNYYGANVATYLIEKLNANVYITKNNQTAFSIARERHNEGSEIVKLLEKHTSPLIRLTVEQKYDELYELLKNNNALYDIDAVDFEGNTVLTYLLNQVDDNDNDWIIWRIINMLLEKGIDVNLYGYWTYGGPVSKAIKMKEDSRFIDRMLEDATQKTMNDAMFTACYYNFEMVMHLVEKYNINVNITNDSNRSCLMRALYGQNYDIAYYLLHHNADIHAVDDEDCNVLDAVFYHSRPNFYLIKYFIEHGVEVNIGIIRHALSWSFWSEDYENIIYYLIEHVDKEILPPNLLLSACFGQSIELIKYIQNITNADYNLKNAQDETCLMLALGNEQADSTDVSYFLIDEIGVDLYAINMWNETAISIARSLNTEIAAYLEKIKNHSY